MIRLLVSGGRYYSDRPAAYAAFDLVLGMRPIEVVIQGECPAGGADKLADEWAILRGLPREPYPVDTKLDGDWPQAGVRRNARMLRLSRPTLVLALPGGRGTADMMRRARAAGVSVWQPYKGDTSS